MKRIFGLIANLFSPITSLLSLFITDVSDALRPLALFVFAYVNDFFTLVKESDGGWLKCAASVCVFVPICISVTGVSFAVAYYQYVLGNAILEAPIFFRYADGAAFARLDHVWLTPQNAYSFEMSLQYPESEHNHALGIVMASLVVELPLANNDSDSLVLLREPRPLMPRYRSPLLRTMATVASAAPLILGLWHEETRMSMTLATDWRPIDGLHGEDDLLLSSLPLRISVHFDKPLQLYTSHLTVRPRLSGLSYWWTEWFWPTSVIFCSWMVLWQTILYTILWVCFARCLVEEMRATRDESSEGPLRRRRQLRDEDELYEWDTLLREHRAEREQRMATKAAMDAAAASTAASATTAAPVQTDDNDDDDNDEDTTSSNVSTPTVVAAVVEPVQQVTRRRTPASPSSTTL